MTTQQQLSVQIACVLRHRAILLAERGSVGPDERATDPLRCERYQVIVDGHARPCSGSINAASYFISMVGAKQAEAALAKYQEEQPI